MVPIKKRLQGCMGIYLRPVIRFLHAAVFPPKCLVCGTFDGMRTVHAQASLTSFPFLVPYLCSSCRSDVAPIESPMCTRCGMPFVGRTGMDHTCSQCLLEERYFTKARSFGVFKGSLMEAIHRFKYKKKLELAVPLADLAKTTFFQFWDPATVDVVIPVPLHIQRLRQRGFNQAYLLINRWAKQSGLRCDGFALRRLRPTAPQTSMDRVNRRKNVKGAFMVAAPERIAGKRVLLVDDVYTTGSTVDECARVLMKAGARSVDVLTLARTGPY